MDIRSLERTFGEIAFERAIRAGRFAKAMLNAPMRCRIHPCTDLVDIDCRLTPPPFGGGTNDPETDAELSAAWRELLSQPLARACADSTLVILAYAGACPAGGQTAFGVAGLAECLRTTQDGGVLRIFDLVFPHRCGDGQATAGETCDDGNIIDGDGCSSQCAQE